MYKAKEDIGDYKKGDTVPDVIAIVWSKMYKESPVEEIKGKSESPKQKGESSKEPKEDKSSKDSSDEMLDDYLNRNENVVKKNIFKDKLTIDTLQKLLKIEEGDKKRGKVIKAIKKRMEGL